MVTEAVRERISRVIREGDTITLGSLLDEVIRSTGWPKARDTLKTALLTICRGQWFAVNRIILQLADAEELIGYDGDMIEILDTISQVDKIEDLQQKTSEAVIPLVQSQVANGGSTHFFDVDAMRTRPSMVLVSQILDARRKEFVQAAALALRSDEKMDDSLLPETTYGLGIITGMEIVLADPEYNGRREQDPLKEVLENLEVSKEELDIAISKPPSRIRFSNRMGRLVKALSSRYREREPWRYIFASGFRDPFQFLRDATEKLWAWEGWDRLSDSDKASGNVINPYDLPDNEQWLTRIMFHAAIDALGDIQTREALDLLTSLLDDEKIEAMMVCFYVTSRGNYNTQAEHLHMHVSDVIARFENESTQEQLETGRSDETV
ncbi:MAG: hypothetical protein ACE5H4_16020 [Candidatus Thorarchaeota archaeon]